MFWKLSNLDNFDLLSKYLISRNVCESDLLLIKTLLQKKKIIIKEKNLLQKNRNELSKEGIINAIKVKEIKINIKKKELELNDLEEKLNLLISNIPNIPAIDTPSNQEGNKIIEIVEYKHNIYHKLVYEEIIKKLNLIDEEKSILLSGSKFVVYQNLGSLLLHALISFLLSKNIKNGYKIFDTPYLVKKINLYNTGQIPRFNNELYKIENNDYYLIPTAEVSLINLFQNQIIDINQLPLKVCGYSPCFRSEAGSAGKENKSLIRLHQFHKVEIIRIVHPENSYQEFKEMVNDVKSILDSLKITYRIVDLCYSELGFSSAKTYDFEVFLPISNKWMEISSCSNCEDFQAFRAKIRYKNKEKKNLLHTLNASALAIDRLIIALCEYYYNKDKNQLELPNELEKFFLKIY